MWSPKYLRPATLGQSLEAPQSPQGAAASSTLAMQQQGAESRIQAVVSQLHGSGLG